MLTLPQAKQADGIWPPLPENAPIWNSKAVHLSCGSSHNIALLCLITVGISKRRPKRHGSVRGETNGSPGVREQQKALLVRSLVAHVSGFGCNENTAESQFVVFTRLEDHKVTRSQI